MRPGNFPYKNKDCPVSTATAKAAPAAEISTDAHPSLKEVDRPANLTPANTPGWGSDVIAESLRDLDIPYIALNPGAVSQMAISGISRLAKTYIP